MEIDIIEKHDNLLLERTEVKVKVKHTKEAHHGSDHSRHHSP